MRPALLFVVVLIAGSSSAQNPATGTNNGSYRIRASVVSPSDQSIWALAARTSSGPERCELWHADDNGFWRPAPIQANPSIERFEDVIAATNGGDVYVVGWADGRMQLIKVQAVGTTSFVRPMAIRSGRLLGLVPAERGVLLFGQNSRGAFAAKFDESGLRLWNIEIDEHPQAAAFVEATLVDDGYSLLKARVYDLDQDGPTFGRTRTFVIKVDAGGRIIQSKSLAERTAAVPGPFIPLSTGYNSGPPVGSFRRDR